MQERSLGQVRKCMHFYVARYRIRVLRPSSQVAPTRTAFSTTPTAPGRGFHQAPAAEWIHYKSPSKLARYLSPSCGDGLQSGLNRSHRARNIFTLPPIGTPGRAIFPSEHYKCSLQARSFSPFPSVRRCRSCGWHGELGAPPRGTKGAHRGMGGVSKVGLFTVIGPAYK